MWSDSGIAPCRDGARRAACPGTACGVSPTAGCPLPAFTTPIASAASAFSPEARAGCGNSARPDLVRGLWATMIPTQTPPGSHQALRVVARKGTPPFSCHHPIHNFRPLLGCLFNPGCRSRLSRARTPAPPRPRRDPLAPTRGFFRRYSGAYGGWLWGIWAPPSPHSPNTFYETRGDLMTASDAARDSFPSGSEPRHLEFRGLRCPLLTGYVLQSVSLCKEELIQAP
jgi:hypothetical protein